MKCGLRLIPVIRVSLISLLVMHCVTDDVQIQRYLGFGEILLFLVYSIVKIINYCTLRNKKESYSFLFQDGNILEWIGFAIIIGVLMIEGY